VLLLLLSFATFCCVVLVATLTALNLHTVLVYSYCEDFDRHLMRSDHLIRSGCIMHCARSHCAKPRGGHVYRAEGVLISLQGMHTA
jgi:hypothetical protein